MASEISESEIDHLRGSTHMGDLLVAALAKNASGNVLELGDTTLTGAQMADEISRYVQAFEGLGSGTGSSVGLLALNRPEVLFVIGAGQTQGWRRTALHPLGSLDDHAYVLSDAGVTTLVIDPVPMFVERAVALMERVDGLKQIFTLGPVPEELSEVGRDVVAEAAGYDATTLTAAELSPDHIMSITYTGGTTGKPKGVIGTVRAMTTMTQIQLSEWEWPTRPRFLMCTPLSHAGDFGEGLGNFDSRPWLGEIDVPTSVVVSTRDHTVEPERQQLLVDGIPGARRFDVDGGHACCVIGVEKFLPPFVAAVDAAALASPVLVSRG